MTFLVIGIDAATWKIIKPNINELKNFRRLMKIGRYKTLILNEKPISASAWCSIFSGKTPEEHKHKAFVENGNLKTRDDIKVDFIWDILHKQNYDVRALNIPFVIPPYNFNCKFKPVGYGLPETPDEWQEELEKVTSKAIEILEEKPDLLCVVYSLLDRIQHFHWNEPIVLEWYKRIDSVIGKLILYADKFIIISDHGFCDRDDAEVQTLPEKTPRGEIKGDHDKEAILITNIDYDIEKLQDVFYAIMEEMKNGQGNYGNGI
ncbi:MAG: hypothetical protein DRO94_01725 [Candidatus Altiarchaeales archaeon]|nr:MAG: hypothetical protein DRO95_01955 [Candidatus Altiarchaeales archaeon]RLI94905.1 MAG: hypothetical protein DRO94_01725 [Candidatus Altiarchaeales archaeon]HDO82161.1 hypothetical protein [Candidatus Altiarchaeales archaeon]HEX54810.1 hypothetical protein [Candidatus Altiarchaeales archaeon]